MADRSSRPRRSPRQTSQRQTKRILRLRQRGWGPARIGPYAGMPASRVSKGLHREGVPARALLASCGITVVRVLTDNGGC